MEGINSINSVFADTSYLSDCSSARQNHYIDDTDTRDKNKSNEIFALLNKLTFDISEADKESFFSELEATLENCPEEKIEDNVDLYKFLTKYAV